MSEDDEFAPRGPSETEIFTKGLKLFSDELNDTQLDEDSEFERRLIRLSDEVRAKLVAGQLIDEIQGREPLDEEIIQDILTGLDTKAKMAALYQRNEYALEAQTLTNSLEQIAPEMDAAHEEQSKLLPEINRLTSLDPTDKTFQLQATLGRFEEVAKSNPVLSRILESIEDDLVEAINLEDEERERDIWGVVLSLRDLPPEQFGETLDRLSSLFDNEEIE